MPLHFGPPLTMRINTIPIDTHFALTYTSILRNNLKMVQYSGLRYKFYGNLSCASLKPCITHIDITISDSFCVLLKLKEL